MASKKNVGILSMQRVLNYGSFLQAYALKQLLLEHGAGAVYFIDIKPGRVLEGFAPDSKLKKLKRYLKVFLSFKLFSRIRDKKFTRKLGKSIASKFYLLGLNDKAPKHFDLVVIGSDEVFNCCQRTSWGYTLQLYGEVNNTNRVISYAGSFGHTTYEQLLSYGIESEISNAMHNMSAISVRDRNSYDIVTKLVGKSPELHLDPVLIYGYKNEIDHTMPNVFKTPYMIVYSYQGRIQDRKEIEQITSYAKTKKLRLISVFCRYDWCDEAVIPETPFEVLPLFKNAEYIVTDTFHGTIFSIITESNFCTLIRDTNEQKISSLLESLELADRKVDKTLNLSEILDTMPYYERVNQILDFERQRANNYIDEQMSLI